MPDDTYAEALTTRIVECIAAATAAMLSIRGDFRQFSDAIEQMARVFSPGYPYRTGDPVPPECRIVRPARGSATWLAWYGDHWRPVRRVNGRGFVWGCG